MLRTLLLPVVAAALLLAARLASGEAREGYFGGHSPKTFSDKDLDLLLDPSPSFLPAPGAGRDDTADALPPLQDDFFGASTGFGGGGGGHHHYGAIAAAKTIEGKKKMARKAVKDPATFKVTDPSEDCRFELDGEEFDLTPLRLSDGQRPYRATDQSKMKYELNVCGLVTNEGPAQRANAMIAQFVPGPNPSLDGVISRWDAKPHPVWSYIDDRRPEAGVKMVTANGDTCSFRGVQKEREALIFFPCSPRSGKVGRISVSETSTCTYVISIPTELSCPGEAGSSWGWHFLTLLFVVSAAYFGLGYLYIRHRTGAEGVAAIPNSEFWQDVPALVKEGMAYSYERFSFYKAEYASKHADDGI